LRERGRVVLFYFGGATAVGGKIFGELLNLVFFLIFPENFSACGGPKSHQNYRDQRG